MTEIIPSLPALSYHELSQKLAIVRGLVSTFQIDVADGMFVPSRSWPMNPGDDVQFERLVRGQDRLPFADEFEFEVHFMAHSPEKLLPEWARVGIVRALFHIEARHDFPLLRTIAEREGIELGVALKIETPLERIEPYIAHLSCIQLMGIASIGIQGQPFDQRVIEKLQEARKRFPNVTLEVDGAVNDETAPLLVSAGATRLAPGSYVFRAENPDVAIQNLQSLHT